jgi:hypothetical protein
VMGLLCAVSLRPGQAPPSAVPTSRRYRGATDAFAGLADGATSTAEPRHWELRFSELTAAQRDGLAPLVLAIRLRRAVRARDLVLVQALLRVAADHELLDAPAPRQALELLNRARLMQREVALAEAG